MDRKLGFVMAFVTFGILSLQAATVSGVVKEGDSTGVVVPNAIVTLFTGGGGQSLIDTTDATGAFSFTGIAAGNRQLRATKTGYTNLAPIAIAVTDSAAGVYVNDLYLISSSIRANITGTVTDTVSALPKEQAQVVIRNGTFRDTVFTDAAGLFKFDTLGPGTYTVSVSLTGYVTKGASVTISSATVPAIEVKLAPIVYATISGIVTDSVSTLPVPSARVILQSGTRRDTVVTTATGAFSFDSVASGTYTLNTALTGYTTKNTNGSVSSATVPAISILLIPIQYASISGTVTDSTAATAISGATVILRTSGGGMGTAVDTAVTDTIGKYAFEKVTSGRSYTISATATGYVARTTAAIALTGTTAVTADVKIMAITMGKIAGIVTSDSLKGSPVPGATVVLSLRNAFGGGGTGTPLDTMTSDSTGAFLFENVASGSNYRVTATLAGYASAYSSINGKTGGTDTANIALPKIGTGSLLVRVLNSADSTALPGATITAITTGSGTALSGVSGTDGSSAFSGFEITTTALNVSVTASAAGYTAAAGAGSIPKNGTDTVSIYLTAATTGTKFLTGVISDSTSKALLSNVRVVLTITSGGIGGGTSLTFIDTTGIDGAYVFSGIPVDRNSGTLAATLTGYPYFNRNNVAIGAANVADTTTLNIVLLKTTAVGPGVLSAIAVRPEFRLSATGILLLNNFAATGMVKIFSIDGKLLFKSAINPLTKALRLPTNLVVSGKTLLVSVSQNKEMYRKLIMIP